MGEDQGWFPPPFCSLMITRTDISEELLIIKREPDMMAVESYLACSHPTTVPGWRCILCGFEQHLLCLPAICLLCLSKQHLLICLCLPLSLYNDIFSYPLFVDQLLLIHIFTLVLCLLPLGVCLHSYLAFSLH